MPGKAGIIHILMKNILIIGAKGMLGQELVATFKKDKELSVTAWDKEDIDITDEKDVKKKISEVKPDVILNAAEYDEMDKCEEDGKELGAAKKMNTLASEYLAKAAKKIGAVLVHYSSDYVFNGEPEIPEPEGCNHSCSTCGLHDGFAPQIGFKEEDKVSPISKYGKTKAEGEKAVSKNAGKYYIIRFSKLFGRSGDVKGSKKGFFETMIEEGEKKKQVKAVDEEVSFFTYAPDLARKTKEIIESKKPFGIYHVTNDGLATWYEAAIELFKIAKIKTKVVPIFAGDLKHAAKRPFYSALLNTKLNPMRDWKEALKDYLKSIK